MTYDSGLKVTCQPAGFIDFGILHQIVQDLLQIADIFGRGCIFHGRHPDGFFIGGQIQKIGFNAVGPAISGGVGVNRNKQIRVFGVGKGRALFKG